MSISAEEKVCYLREAAIVLAKEGFQLDEVHTDRLCILLDGSPLCEVTESGGVAYRNEDIDEPERIAAKDKVYEIVRTTAEYMRQMEMAPFLKADGLEDGYKVLADFNGTVLAGVQSKHGVHFVTWDWAYGHTGVCHGHYFMENYAGAKQDFAIRSGLIQKERLFTPEQMTEIYRCCADSVDGDFFELTGEQEKMIRSVQQQIEECVPDLDERIRQQEEALEQVAQQQTIGVYLPVRHGTGVETLERTVGHVVGTSLPVGGAGTQAVLSAHSGMASAKLFTDIDQLVKGDVFYIHVLGEALAYEVDQIATVLPGDTSLLQIEDGQDLVTLVTCTPFGVNTHRLLVRGHRVPYVAELVVENGKTPKAASSWTQHYLTGLGIGLGVLAAVGGACFFARRKRRG